MPAEGIFLKFFRFSPKFKMVIAQSIFKILEFKGPYRPIRNSTPCRQLARFAHKSFHLTHTMRHRHDRLLRNTKFVPFYTGGYCSNTTNRNVDLQHRIPLNKLLPQKPPKTQARGVINWKQALHLYIMKPLKKCPWQWFLRNRHFSLSHPHPWTD